MSKSTEEKVVEAVERQKSDENLIELSTGVVLRGKAAPSLALIKVIAAFPRPKPPEYFNEALGRLLENPADPDYLKRVQSHEAESAVAVLNVLILLGTEVVSVPKGFPKADSDAWIEEYKEVGLPARPENKSWRYLNWVMFKAAPTAEDTQKIQEVVGALSGVSERAAQAAERFPGRDQTL